MKKILCLTLAAFLLFSNVYAITVCAATTYVHPGATTSSVSSCYYEEKHVHNGSPTTGGGCYTVHVTPHVHTDECYEWYTCGCTCDAFEDCGYHAIDGYVLRRCLKCGHLADFHGENGCTVKKRGALICTKQEGVSYTVGCGYADDISLLVSKFSYNGATNVVKRPYYNGKAVKNVYYNGKHVYFCK